MNSVFLSLLDWFASAIPDLLMSEPIIYFVGVALLCFVIKVFLTFVRKGV